ncbi:hypothetical protein VPNG_09969 [Cytospora leucostoma]|uniref:DUF3328 domain-containing protein n=1 Tax=Cytospora leucostoma TaxID=1230097 RepID=A0A423VK74_9PEZI|nr:hypothetical protein VPNG_09969 [Cytospora leucostoma]
MDLDRSSSSIDHDEERQALFSDKEHDALWSPVLPTSSNTTRAFTWTRLYVFALHVALFLVGTLFWLSSRKHSEVVDLAGRSWSPVHPYIEYEISADNSSLYDSTSKYSGPPSEELDDAWWELLEPAVSNASAEEIERAGESLDAVAEVTMGGYLAGLGVYHELHCLRRIRSYIHEYYYYPNISKSERRDERHHLDHCTELLRTRIMCHASTDLEVFWWGEHSPVAPEARSSAKRVCVRWDSLHDCSKTRFVSGDDPPVKPRPER